MRIVVQVYALAEPDLERTLDAYAACHVPAFVTVDDGSVVQSLRHRDRRAPNLATVIVGVALKS